MTMRDLWSKLQNTPMGDWLQYVLGLRLKKLERATHLRIAVDGARLFRVPVEAAGGGFGDTRLSMDSLGRVCVVAAGVPPGSTISLQWLGKGSKHVLKKEHTVAEVLPADQVTALTREATTAIGAPMTKEVHAMHVQTLRDASVQAVEQTQALGTATNDILTGAADLLKANTDITRSLATSLTDLVKVRDDRAIQAAKDQAAHAAKTAEAMAELAVLRFQLETGVQGERNWQDRVVEAIGLIAEPLGEAVGPVLSIVTDSQPWQDRERTAGVREAVAGVLGKSEKACTLSPEEVYAALDRLAELAGFGDEDEDEETPEPPPEASPEPPPEAAPPSDPAPGHVDLSDVSSLSDDDFSTLEDAVKALLLQAIEGDTRSQQAISRVFKSLNFSQKLKMQKFI